jgi:hypothetical protein
VTIHRQAWLLAQAEAKNRLPTGTSAKIAYCPRCGCPMVDSAAGRLAHQRRSPKCQVSD